MNMHRTFRQPRSALSLMLTVSVLLASGASASADLSDLHKAVQEKLPEVADNVQNAIHDRIENSDFDVAALQEGISSFSSALEESIAQAAAEKSASGSAASSGSDASGASDAAGTAQSAQNDAAAADTGNGESDPQTSEESLPSKISGIAIAVHDALAENHYRHETNVDVQSGITREFDFGADNSKGIAIARGGASSASSSSSSGGAEAPAAAEPAAGTSDSSGSSSDDHSINDTISISLQDQDGNTRIVNLSLNVDHLLSGNTLDKVENITVLSNNTHTIKLFSGNSKSIAIARGGLLGGGASAAAAASSSSSGSSAAAAAASSGRTVTVIRSVEDPAPAEKGPVVTAAASTEKTITQATPVDTGDTSDPGRWTALALIGLCGTAGCILTLRRKRG